MQGNIAKWLVAEGQPFAAGDILADIETDKATMGWESQEDGIMGKILKPQGSKDIPVGTLVAITVEEESELASLANYTPGSGAAAAPPAAAAAAEGASDAAAPSGSSAFPPHQVW